MTLIHTRLAICATLLPTMLAMTPSAAFAQQEGLMPTQTLVETTSKDNVAPAPAQIKLEVNSRKTPVTSFEALPAANVQIALLIDDGLSRTAGIQLNDLRKFATTLPPGMELLVGYMSNGSIKVEMPFTADHAAAAEKIRLPFGVPGVSASPYFCLSEFVKHWPGGSEEEAQASHAKARFVMMITNGVDPYNGSVSITNQDSPYVQAAASDAQRAGVSVSAIYYRDAGTRGGAASFSGQSYLQQVADATGGRSYYQGTLNPVSLLPYLQEFTHALSETFVATFGADGSHAGRDRLVSLKISTKQPGVKLHAAQAVRPGNVEGNSGAQQ